MFSRTVSVTYLPPINPAWRRLGPKFGYAFPLGRKFLIKFLTSRKRFLGISNRKSTNCSLIPLARHGYTLPSCLFHRSGCFYLQIEYIQMHTFSFYPLGYNRASLLTSLPLSSPPSTSCFPPFIPWKSPQKKGKRKYEAYENLWALRTYHC